MHFTEYFVISRAREFIFNAFIEKGLLPVGDGLFGAINARKYETHLASISKQAACSISIPDSPEPLQLASRAI